MPGQPAWMTGPSFEADTPPAPMPVAFAFKVAFINLPDTNSPLQCSFREVSGLAQSLETEDVAEGGENSFVHQLPVRAKPGRLLLKRGLVDRDSALVSWCQEVLQWGLDRRIALADVQVQLFDAQDLPVMTWLCNGAYPVRWALDSLESTKNEAAIEEIELAYRNCMNVSTT